MERTREGARQARHPGQQRRLPGARRSDFEDLTEEHFDRTLKTNLYGYFHMAKAAVPHMKPGRRDRQDRLGHRPRGQQGAARLFDDQGRHPRLHPLALGAT